MRSLIGKRKPDLSGQFLFFARFYQPPFCLSSRTTMSITVRFPTEVRDWISHNLTRGVAPQAIVGELVERKNAVELASAMVDAVTSAFMYGTALPGDTLEVGGAPVNYVPEPLRVPHGALISLGARK